MKICSITFTRKGEDIGEKIKGLEKQLSWEVTVYNRSHPFRLSNHFYSDIFKQYEGLIFVSATGIAVRKIAPYIKDKKTDPAVIVIDDLGRYVISLLSGHLGGANKMCDILAKGIKGTPIITTATDSRGLEAIDLYATRIGTEIGVLKSAMKISALMLENQPLKFIDQVGIMEKHPPIGYTNIDEVNYKGVVIISEKSEPMEEIDKVNNDVPLCQLVPKCLHVGMGCRRGKSFEELLKELRKVCIDHNLNMKAIKSLETIELKGNEEGLIQLAKHLKVPLRTHSIDEIKPIEEFFECSAFVRKTIGVGAVAEPCAYLSSKNIIVQTVRESGITIAISKEA